MKFNLFAIFSLFFTLNSCGQDIITVKSETIGNYKVNNTNFYINISKVSTGATSPDFMQIRRVYNDSTYDVVNNIRDVDSVVQFKCSDDTLTLVVRGRLWAEHIENRVHKFSINDIWSPIRVKIKNE